MKATEIGAKIIAAIVLFVVTFGATILPHKLKQFNKDVLKNISCFCGGLFMGLCFLHLIPDSLRDFNGVPQLSKLQKTYPMAELTICVGMMIVMIAEKLATVIQNERDERRCDASKDCCKETCQRKDDSIPLYGSFNKTRFSSRPSGNTESLIYSNGKVDGGNTPLPNKEDDGEAIVTVSKTEPDPLLSIKMRKETRSKMIKTICLVIALMVHSLFEGLTVGLQRSTYGLIELVAVLAFHKSIIGFSLGMAIVNTEKGLKFHLKQAILFAVASPFGIMFGAILLSTKFNLFNKGAMAVLICLATGTFFYITFFEILAKELGGKRKKDLISFSYFLIGFGVFAGITALPAMQS